MEVLIKTAVVAVAASIAGIIIRRGNAEMVIPLAAAVCAGTAMLSAGLIRPIMELMKRAGDMSGVSAAFFMPVVKSVGIGICTRIASDLCRDSGQGAIAGCVEMAGTICALYTALPLMETLLDTLEELC